MALQNWNIDLTHSSIDFSVRHMVVAKVRGHFTRWNGTLQLDPDQLTASSVEVRIESGSIDTREPKRDAHLRSPDFLDAEGHPVLEFRSTRVETESAESLKIHGELTIRGVTREVVLDTEYGGRAKDPWGGERMGFTARTKINRKDFGLQWNQVLETGGVMVGDVIEINLEIEAVRAA
jgi:polyisoprenoid-binding protein YceI